uniref:RRM domain-containing protein n=1 Tax=Aotus nancymaae TaxID=37293 RepID=A0A2K5C3E9_AOTNA
MASARSLNTQSPDMEKMAAGVEAVAEVAVTEIKMEEESGRSRRAEQQRGSGMRREEKNMKRGGNHFEPYWQSLKDLVKEKVGEVELLMDAEGKSRRCAVVEFKMEESMKKAAEVLNKHSLSGRPLKVKEDPDGEHARRAGRLGSTVFVKLKEVFSMAGVVVRADILRIKMEKVLYLCSMASCYLIDQCMSRWMRGVHNNFPWPWWYWHGVRTRRATLDANHLNKGIGMGNIGPARMGMEGIGFGINKMGGMEGPFGGGMENMGRFGSGMNMGRINEILSNALKRGEIIAKRGGGGVEAFVKIFVVGKSHGCRPRPWDRVGSEIEHMGLVMDCMGSVQRMGSGIECMGPLGLDHMASSIERMGQTMERIGSGVESMGAGMGFGLECMAAPIDRVGQTIERMGLSMERMVPAGMGAGLERMGPVMDRMATGLERMGANNLEQMGLERMGANSLERMGPAMGPALGAGIERMGLAMGGGGSASFDRTIKIERGNFGGSFAGSFGGAGGHAPGVARKACQIFVRNLPFNFTWKMLKDKFNECGHVLYADIKMENGKSKGCSVVKFESPEVAERPCWMMNGMKLSGREIDVRIDRNA